MLTKCRIEKILELVKKEYDYMDNKPIHIIDWYGWGRCWCVDTTDSDYILRVDKNFEDYNFMSFYYEYLAKEFNFDLTWAEVDYQNTMNAIVLLHEIGHIQQTMDMILTKEWVKKMNIAYNNFRAETMFMSAEKQSIAYRKISYEYLADKFAVEIFNKYAVKILAILNGVSQKEIKNRLEEVKKSVA